jgi:hypothetical protein
MFEILVNGTPRTYRDDEELAIDAGRRLKARDKSEIAVFNTITGMWLAISDAYSPVGAWKNPPVLGVVRRTG